MLNVGAASALCGQISVASKLPQDGHSLSVAKAVGAKLLGGTTRFRIIPRENQKSISILHLERR